ncbi:hypothetical protein QYF36_026205 [Acer negundo]|nr:hypothetical protein QYF36_026205 [Acer negundo]
MDRTSFGIAKGRHLKSEELQCQTRRWKTAGRRKKETDSSNFEMSEEDRDFSNKSRKNIQEKRKMKWVPKPRQIVQKEGFGKLIIGERQGQMGREVVSDSTSTSVEEVLLSDFKRWRGECSRKGVRPYEKERVIGPQKVLFSKSQSLEGPLREYLESIE